MSADCERASGDGDALCRIRLSLVRTLLCLAAATAWLVGSVCSSTRAYGQSGTQATASGNDWHFQYDLFQMLLEEHGLTILPGLEPAWASPETSVVVMTGRLPASFSSRDWGQLVDFIQNGGTLLLASDTSMRGPEFGQFFSGPVTTENSRYQYRGFDDCLQIPLSAEAASRLPGVSQIVTNRSGWFVGNPIGWLNWETLAQLPADCLPPASRSASVLSIGRPLNQSGGLAIVAADASLFSNGMLWHGDNAIAAIRVSDLLYDARKTQLAVLADGQALRSYRLGEAALANQDSADNQRQLPEPELQKALRLANAVAREIAASNVLNEALRQQPRNVRPAHYFRALLILFACIGLLGGVALLLANGQLRAMLLPQRRMRAAYEMHEYRRGGADDYRNEAGQLAREFCYELSGSRHSADWQKIVADSSAPSSVLDEGERQKLARIVDIACRGCHAKLPRAELQLLGKSMRRLRSKHQDHSRSLPKRV